MDIEHTSKISTLEVTVSQQAIQIKKLQERIDELEYTDTDEVLMEADIPVDVSAIYREKYPSVFKPVPYPYTHPIRDIPAGGGRVSKEKAFLDDAFNYGISLEGVNVPIGDWGISY